MYLMLIIYSISSQKSMDNVYKLRVIYMATYFIHTPTYRQLVGNDKV